MIPEADWEKAVAALASSGRVAIACHVNPDGDALGSMIGVGRFLKRRGAEVFMGWGSGRVEVPPQYEFLPGAKSLNQSKDFPDTAETFVAIDCADAQRLGLLQPKFDAAATRINIDHHVSNDDFGDINLVDPDAASSSELAYELIKRMGGVPDVDEATCLYTGIVTDTGRFQYVNTSPMTLRTAADLREIGVDHEKVASEVFESNSFEYLHVLGIVLSRAKLEDGMIWSWLDHADLGSLDFDETEHFIDHLRAVAEAEVAVLLKQWAWRADAPRGSSDSGSERVSSPAYKASLRSRGKVDVAAIAKALGGGGHERAAGFEMRGSAEEIVGAIRKLIPQK